MNIKNVKSVVVLLSLLIALFAGASRTPGQEVSAAITGTVVDPAGAPIQGASVTARDVNRGVVFTGESNGDGVYYLARVPVGFYEVRVESKGFQTALRPTFELVLNQVARIDVQMVVGSVSQTVEVTSSTPLLQTETTELSTHIDHVVAEDIPLLTRNYGQLTLLTPGAVSTNPGAFTSGQNTFQVGRPYINGNREQTSNYILDGIDNNQHDNNEVAYSPSPDAIQEFNLITQNPSAEFGNFLGGILNATIKSGTNSHHGSAYEFLRNDKLNANSWSNNLIGTPKQALRYNQFGATVGGPIIKNRLFFFADYQGLRNPTSSTQTAQVLSAAERGGNLGELCPAGFDASGLCTSGTNGNVQLYKPQAGQAPTARAFIPFNNLTAAGLTLSSAAKAIVTSPLYPAANFGTNLFNYSQTVGNSADQGDLKIDWTPTDKDRVSGRYSQQAVRNPTSQTYLLANNGFTDFKYPLRNGVIDWTHTIGPSLLNDLRLGLSYFPVSQGYTNPTGQNLPQTFGIPGSPSTFAPAIGGLLSGVTPIANNLAQFNTFADTVIQVGDSVLKTYGNHEFRAGFQFNRYRDNFLYPGNEGLAGFFSFNGQYTNNPTAPDPADPKKIRLSGSGLADFLLGFPNNLGIGQGVGDRHMQNSLYSVYGQDNWRIRRNITLNLGLRWEVNTPRAAAEGNAVNYKLIGGDIITPTVNNMGLGKALYHQYNGITNFQPRIGVAWQPDFIKNTVVHGAFGVSNFTESNGVNNLLTQNPPFEQANNVTFPSVGAGSDLPASTLDQGFVGFPTGCTLALAQAFSPTCFSGVNIHAFDVNLRPAVHYQWNLAIQHQFGNATTVQIGYVGQENQHLANIIMLQQRQLNADGTVSPSPFLNPTLLSEPGQRRYTLSNGVSNYHALQAILQERFHNGLQAQLNYTWSKCMSDTPGFFGQFGDNVATESQTIAGWAFPQDPYNQHGDYGRCPQDVKHLFNGYVVYELPFGHGKRYANNVGRAADLAIGGWRVSSSFVFHTGFSQTIFASSDTSGTGGFSTRADCVAGVPARVPMTFDPNTNGVHFLNPAAVTNPAAGSFGSCPVGAFDGPGYKSADLSIAKVFSITERHNLEFRMDATNFTNTPIFNFGQEFSGQHTATANNFGEIFSSQGSRQIQFALKYRF
ncbi:MAG TPA: TonB-dependent receptor [Candidatus Dormibacteraeota bacterium]|nr:TonB-dependent receptor [Candidatus Dormibacteraeota bacterium]